MSVNIPSGERQGGTTPRRLYPMPEALVEGAWTIRPSNEAHAMVNKNAKELFVPLGNTEHDFELRTHELAHVKWSPDKPEEYEGVTPTALLAIEDARIEYLLQKNDMALVTPMPLTPQQIMRLQSRVAGNPLEAAGLYACSRYSGSREIMADLTRGVIGREGQRLIDEQLEAHEDVAEDFEAYSVDLARWVTANFIGREDRMSSESLCMGMGHNPHGSAGPGAPKGPPGRGEPDDNEFDVPWGDLEIETPPLTQGLPPHKRKRTKRAADTGVHLSRIHRLLTDERVFRVKGRKKDGGSLLIDVSGSMDLNSDQVKQMMEAMPSAIIAMYWGEDTSGTLRVIAKNGRCVDDGDMEPDGGGNIVDGPALEWLCQQQEPRIWVCDGVVTGHDDECSPALDRDAERIVAKGRITRIESVDDVLEAGASLLAR